jgi:hypothetical protein
MDADATRKVVYELIRERLFGKGPWLVTGDTARAIFRRFEELGLQVPGIGPRRGATPDETLRRLNGENVGPSPRYIYSTPLGSELDADLMGIFAGIHECGQIPDLLGYEGLITKDEMFELYDRWEFGGEDLETILRPVVQRVFLRYLETKAIVS